MPPAASATETVRLGGMPPRPPALLSSLPPQNGFSSAATGPSAKSGGGLTEIAGSPLQSALLCQQGQRVPAGGSTPAYPPSSAGYTATVVEASGTQQQPLPTSVGAALPPIGSIKNNYKVIIIIF